MGEAIREKGILTVPWKVALPLFFAAPAANSISTRPKPLVAKARSAASKLALIHPAARDGETSKTSLVYTMTKQPAGNEKQGRLAACHDAAQVAAKKPRIAKAVQAI